MHPYYVCLHTYYSYVSTYICTYVVHIGVSLGRQSPLREDIINPAYHSMNDTDDHCKKPVEEPIRCYAEVSIPPKFKTAPEVKMTPNPAYAMP